jgi:hypothetical protein
MPSIYRKIKQLLNNNYFWLLDYFYILRAQSLGVISRSQASSYQNPQSPLPSIILIPGIYEKWQFMEPIAHLLRSHHYDVHVIEDLGYNRRGVEDMARMVNDYIHAANLHEVIMIAHSKGGLIGKFLLANPNADGKIKGLIALNTPFSGSLYAYLFLLFKSIRIFTPRSPILTYLAKNQQVNASIVSIYGQFDPHIPRGSKLEGARNIQLETYGHFRIVDDPLVHAAILEALSYLDSPLPKK